MYILFSNGDEKIALAAFSSLQEAEDYVDSATLDPLFEGGSVRYRRDSLLNQAHNISIEKDGLPIDPPIFSSSPRM